MRRSCADSSPIMATMCVTGRRKSTAGKRRSRKTLTWSSSPVAMAPSARSRGAWSGAASRSASCLRAPPTTSRVPWGSSSGPSRRSCAAGRTRAARSSMWAWPRARAASKKLKQAKNPVEDGMARLRREAARAEPLELNARLDGVDISGAYLLMEAVNLRYVGPNLHLAHDSDPGDGQFDVVLVTEAERERLRYYLEHWQDNRERLAMLPTRRGRRLEIEMTGFALHIDDKLRPKAKIKPKEIAGLVEARIDGAAVEFLVPA